MAEINAREFTDVNVERELRMNFTKYKGKYVAIVGEKIVASGENAKSVLDRARAENPEEEVVLRKIPEEETLVLVVGCG